MHPTKYAGFIGFGVLFMWCCALLFWIGMADSTQPLRQVIGYAGAVLVSLSGLAIFLYTHHLEVKVARLEDQLSAARESAALHG